MKELGLSQCFSTVAHVSNMTRGNEILTALEQLDAFSKPEMDILSKKLKDQSFNLGIKSLINAVEKARKTDESFRIEKFLSEISAEDDYGF